MKSQSPNDAREPRQPPHNIEAEQALLGAILLNNAALDRVPFLEPRHFFDPVHADIFEKIRQRVAANRLANPVTLSPFFQNAVPIIDGLTVPQYLGRLAVNATTIINAGEYGRTIQDHATRRALIESAHATAARAADLSSGEPVSVVIEAAEADLFALGERGPGERSAVTLGEAVGSALARADESHQRGDGLGGLSVGITSIDERTGGLRSGSLNILAGRTSMGKTALVVDMASKVAKTGTPVVVFSLEMGAAELALRILSAQSAVPAWAMMRGRFTIDDRRKMQSAERDLADVPLFIDQTGGMTLTQLTGKSRRLKRQRSIGLIVVDYLQLMRAVGRHGNRVSEITEISNGLKALAKEIDVPIIALSQLSRQVENREDKRPQLSDLRESGSIEQDADLVMFVHREEYYLERIEPPAFTPAHSEWMARLAAVAGCAEVIVGKNRYGPVGTASLQFDSRTMTFSDAPDYRVINGGRP